MENIRANLAKQKVKLGKEFDNYVVDEADWVGGYCFMKSIILIIIVPGW